MINLIPPHARKRVVVEYWVRAFTVWSLLIGIACLLLSVSMLPLYVSIDTQRDAYSLQSGEAIDSSAQLAASQVIISETNEAARLLASSADPEPFSTYITELEGLTNAEVQINEIYLDRTEGLEVGEIRLLGFAATREALAAFRTTIESNEWFESVELPFSNLAKDEDVLFNIKVTPAAAEDSSL